jgi:hypothetical protein
MQAAGMDDRSYSVRHGGAQRICFSALRHIRVSRPGPALLRETLLSNMAVANVDTRFRTIEGSNCLSVWMFAFQPCMLVLHLPFLTCYGNHMPMQPLSANISHQTNATNRISHQGFIDCLGYPFGDHSLFTRQASKSTANDSVSRTGLWESRQTGARSKSGDTQL